MLSALVTQILKPRVVPQGVSLCVVFPSDPKSKSHHKVSPVKRLVCPRNPRSDSDAFILPFAMSASFRAEAWKNRQPIDTPKWQIRQNEGSQSTENYDEDISDENFRKMHARCFDALRKENLQILNNLSRKKRGFETSKASHQPSDIKTETTSTSIPVFNYDTSWSASKPWKKPKKFIEMILTPARVGVTSHLAAKRPREFGLKSEAEAEEEELSDSNLDVAAKHQVTLLKLRYLQLRKQLVLLRQRSLENSCTGSAAPVNSVSRRKTSRTNAGVRKKKLDEL